MISFPSRIRLGDDQEYRYDHNIDERPRNFVSLDTPFAIKPVVYFESY